VRFSPSGGSDAADDPVDMARLSVVAAERVIVVAFALAAPLG
jgi:hypothetical protein